MICSSKGTVVIATRSSFPRLLNRIQNRNDVPISVIATRRSSMSVEAFPMRLKSSQKKRKMNIGCGVSPSSPTTTVVDEEVAIRRKLAMRRVLEDNGGDGSSVRDFSLFTTKRGDTLFTQSWTPVDSAKNRSILVLSVIDE